MKSSLFIRSLNRKVRPSKCLEKEILRIRTLIAYMKQFCRLKFSLNVPDEHTMTIERIIQALPEDKRPTTFTRWEHIGSPSTVTTDLMSEFIYGMVTKGIVKTMSSGIRTALQSIDLRLFEDSALSDVSSGEFSNESLPQQVPELDIDGEPQPKRMK